MDIHPQILIFAGSLVAIVALAGLAELMKLGGNPVLTSEAQAAHLAGEAVDGYVPAEMALDREGSAALLRDEEGRILLLKQHGNKFAGRILGETANAALQGDKITIVTGERRFGDVTLTIADAASWAAAINRLHMAHDA